jgi:hypothetical protein
MDNTKRISTIEKWGRHKGQHDLLRYLKGERLTQRESILAHCYDCMGGYDGGAVSCLVTHCPLFPYMPFKNK